jgi:Rrf2 family protein
MLLSRGSQYTLQALIHLARQTDGRRHMLRDIAEQLDIPPFYLAKLMQPVARVGWLDTARGRSGGVRLARGVERLTLLDILNLTEGTRFTHECLLGFKQCEDATACVLHGQWRPIKQELGEHLQRHTLAELAAKADDLPYWLVTGNRHARLER